MIWGESLRTALNDFHEKPYQWGSVDCIQFVSTYVKHCTGIDYAARFPYDSERSALKLMSQHGGVEGLIESCLGAGNPDALPGNVVVCHSENQLIPGVTNGSYVWVLTEKGLGRCTQESIVRAWGV